MREEAFAARMVIRDGWFDVVRGYWTEVGAGPGDSEGLNVGRFS